MFVDLTDTSGVTHHVAMSHIQRVKPGSGPGLAIVECDMFSVEVEVSVDGRAHMAPAAEVAQVIMQARAQQARQLATLEHIGRADAVKLLQKQTDGGIVGVRGPIPVG